MGLPNVNVTATATASPLIAGALTGDLPATGTVTSSWATGSITATDTDSNAQTAGGLVGAISGRLRASSAHVTVTGPASVTQVRLGGLVGFLENNGTITASYATGAVSGGTGTGTSTSSYASGLVGPAGSSAQTTITASYAMGTVTSGAHNQGGLAGELTGGVRAVNNYWDVISSGIADSNPSTSPGTGQIPNALRAPPEPPAFTPTGTWILTA